MALDYITVAAPEDRGGPEQPLLIVEGLTKHFHIHSGILGRRAGTVHAVDDISFSVAKGEVLGVVGESGCGKSTMARLLMHLIASDKGALVFDGDPVGHGGIELKQIDLRAGRSIGVAAEFADSSARSQDHRNLARESLDFRHDRLGKMAASHSSDHCAIWTAIGKGCDVARLHSNRTGDHRHERPAGAVRKLGCRLARLQMDVGSILHDPAEGP